MLIIGAKGFAKEVLEILHQNGETEGLAFFDDVNDDIGDFLYNQFPILKNEESVKEHFSKHGNAFSIGIGNPKLRKLMFEKFSLLGGQLSSTISKTATIGSFNNIIDDGCNIMISTVLTNDIKIGKGTILNQISSIGHDVIIGEFCEICPSVSISGNCEIGNETFVGTGAIILPNIKIGNNVTIGAGAVVSKDLPDHCTAVGIPAKIIKQG
ncbi:acetyltransferase [Chryseobacterium sp.]|uniref:acetyltransferase n=1 Tax=Chryseobacterium sp. TaxID=1871047 RepID=UPI002899DAD0|nr:acetyltransferase [Chryseobacterium sp.]